MYIYVYMYIYICIHICTYIYMYVYIYICIYGGVYLVLCLEADTAATFVPEDVAPGGAIRAQPIKAWPIKAQGCP